MRDYRTSACKKNVLCVDCDDMNCIHAEKFYADCPKKNCIADNCEDCLLIKYYQKLWRRMVKEDEQNRSSRKGL